MSSDTEVIVNPDTYLDDIPHGAFARLRAQRALVWMDEPEVPLWPTGPGFWGVLRHAEIKQVMRDPVTYSSYVGATQISDPPTDKALRFVQGMMLNQDPPRQITPVTSPSWPPTCPCRRSPRSSVCRNRIAGSCTTGATGSSATRTPSTR